MHKYTSTRQHNIDSLGLLKLTIETEWFLKFVKPTAFYRLDLKFNKDAINTQVNNRLWLNKEGREHWEITSLLKKCTGIHKCITNIEKQKQQQHYKT